MYIYMYLCVYTHRIGVVLYGYLNFDFVIEDTIPFLQVESTLNFYMTINIYKLLFSV
jgi:hypothetical protein